MTRFNRYNQAASRKPQAILLSNQRIEYIDTFRAFGIILMIMGHVGFGYKFDYFIHAFHMPMFFFVSGIFFKPSDKTAYRDFVWKKASTLLLPYIYFGSIQYISWTLNAARKWHQFWRFDEYNSMLAHMLTVNTEGLLYAGALWFLTALFFTEIIYYALFHIIRSRYIRDVAIVLLSLLGCSVRYFLPFTPYWALSAALAGLGLYHAGHICRKYIDSFSLSLPMTLILGTITTVLIFLNGYINMRVGKYSFIPMFYVNALLSCAVGINLARILREYLPSWADSLLRRIGMNSIIYLCLNQIVIWLVRKFISTRIIVLILALVLLVLIDYVVYGTRLAILTGRGSNVRHSVMLAGVFFVVVGVIFAGTVYVRPNYKNERVHFPDWSIINTAPLTSSEYSDAEILKSIIAQNIKYLLNTQWNSEQPFSFFTYTSTEYPFTPSDEERMKILRSAESFRNWRNAAYLDIANAVTGYRENAVRPWAHTCFVLAAALRFGLYDENVTGIPEGEAASMACKLIVSLARLHAANSIDGWGMNWQSALWSENIAFAGWLMWEALSQEGREYVTSMVMYEAGRLMDYDVPYYRDNDGNVIYDGDTKAEENAWNSRILALAACMFPESNNHALWTARLKELLLSSTAAPEDTLIDGLALKGSNINSDGTIINHGLHHIDYMTCTIEGMTDTGIIYRLSGQDTPASSYFNHDRIYSALVNADLGTYDSGKAGHHFYERNIDGTAGVGVNMPGQNDWGGKWYASYYLADTEAEILSLDKDCPEGLKAADWAHVHLMELHDMLRRQDSGQFFTEGENNFVSGETYAMHNLIKAYLLRRLKL